MLPKLATRSSQIALTIAYVAMVAINALANILPINGKNTGEVSNDYANLFAPAGFTFSIWSVIYVLLLLHVLYQWGAFHTGRRRNGPLLEQVGVLFTISSLLNFLWIISWHHDMIGLSLLLMAGIFACLAFIVQTVRSQKLTARETLFVAIPFSVYFGWITVASVANITVWLVSLGWQDFGFFAGLMGILIVLVAAVIGTFTMLANRDIAYGLVFVWAYIGILARHVSSDGLDNRYPLIIVTVIVSLIMFGAALFHLLRHRRSFAA